MALFRCGSGGGISISDLVSETFAGSAQTKTIASGATYILVACFQERTTNPADLSDKVYGDITDLEIMSYYNVGSNSRAYCLRFKSTGTSLTLSSAVTNNTYTLIKEP